MQEVTSQPAAGARCVERDGRGGERKKGRESPEIPGAPGVDDCRARPGNAPGRGCRRTDLVLSQGGTTSANFVRYQFQGVTSVVGIRHHSEQSATWFEPMCCLLQDYFDVVNAMTNLVVQAVRKMDLPSWLPFRELGVGPTSPTAPQRSADGCMDFWAQRRRRSSWASPTGVQPRH